MAVNHYNARSPKEQDENDSWLLSKWTPLKKLTDKEYEDLMGEKILKIEADIALIDDRMTDLRAEEKKIEQEGND